MGIKKLSSFVRGCKECWEKIDVRGSKIVIDGYSLCYTLYPRNHGWQLGGEYREFYETVIKYFKRLRELRIEAHIVVDGINFKVFEAALRASPVRRVNVYEQRMKKIANMPYINPPKSLTPLFMKIVFIDAACVIWVWI